MTRRFSPKNKPLMGHADESVNTSGDLPVGAPLVFEAGTLHCLLTCGPCPPSPFTRRVGPRKPSQCTSTDTLLLDFSFILTAWSSPFSHTAAGGAARKSETTNAPTSLTDDSQASTAASNTRNTASESFFKLPDSPQSATHRVGEAAVRHADASTRPIAQQ